MSQSQSQNTSESPNNHHEGYGYESACDTSLLLAESERARRTFCSDFIAFHPFLARTLELAPDPIPPTPIPKRQKGRPKGSQSWMAAHNQALIRAVYDADPIHAPYRQIGDAWENLAIHLREGSSGTINRSGAACSKRFKKLLGDYQVCDITKDSSSHA